SIENPQFVPIPSFVWLYSGQGINSVLPQSTYYSLKKGFVLIGSIVKGEIKLRVGVGARNHQGQLSGEMIQRTPKVMNSVSGHEREAFRHRTNLGDVIVQSARFQIALGADFVGVGLSEGSDLSMKVDDVLFGPFNFEL